MELEKSIRGVISRVNSTLGIYEKHYISCKRTPDSGIEQCESFEQFIEIRFNYECYKVPELQKLIEATDGHLFSCINVDSPDLAKRKFKSATVKILDMEDILEGDEDLKKMLENLYNLLGAKTITFNNLKKKIKIQYE